MLLLLLLLLLLPPPPLSLLLAAAQQPPDTQLPRLLWVSQPARPNSTLLVQGHFPLGRATPATIRALPNGPEARVSAANGWESNTALYFQVPPSFPENTGLKLSILSSSGGAVADSIDVNSPRIKWAQGDAGASATPGGFIRLFGSALAFGPTSTTHSTGTYGEYQLLESELNHALMAHDHAVIAETAARLGALGKALSGVGRPTSLTLTPATGHHVLPQSRTVADQVTVMATNATDVDAHFALPATIAPGEYTVKVRNPAGMTSSLDGWYVDQARPRVSTIHVVKPANSTLPRTFDVADYLPGGFPKGGLNMASGEPANATHAIRGALEAAQAAGGGTVKLPRGKWFIHGPINIPGHTQLVGEETHLTSLYFCAYCQLLWFFLITELCLNCIASLHFSAARLTLD